MKLLVRNIFFIFVLLSLGLGFFYFYRQQKVVEEKYKGYEIVNYNLEGRNLKLLVADTSEKQRKGLMFLRSLDGVDGMIFIYAKKQHFTFWNKDTFLDLDIYWIDDEKVVGKSFLPSVEKSGNTVSVASPGRADKVIEIPIK